MRIEQICFENLNSLVGKWAIDLTDPAFLADGIFAITGPTGAGKTTILDAICLALYGRTPRLSRVNQSFNEIMSRQTGDCFAEVTFLTQAGRFRCNWSQHKARKRFDGALQPPKHELANADTGQIIAASISTVASQIETITGMDFNRFTRSMLLAQGGFAAFLQAASDERAPILEQITGTEIYSQISIMAHEQQRKEQEKLNLLKSETDGINLISADEETAINQQLTELKQQEQELNNRLTALKTGIAWHQTVTKLRQELASFGVEATRLQQAEEEFKPEQVRLFKAHQAARLDGLYATFNSLHKQQADDLAEHGRVAGEQPLLETALQQQTSLHQTAEQQTANARQAVTVAAPLIKQVRGLDLQIMEQSRMTGELGRSCQQYGSEIAAEQQRLLKLQNQHVEISSKLAESESYLAKNSADQGLATELTGIEEQLRGFQAVQAELARQQAARAKADARLNELAGLLARQQKSVAAGQQKLTTVTSQLEQCQQELQQLLAGRLLREYRAEKDGLLREMAFISRIAELESQRSRLQDGQPCPLCGALEHPFAVGNIPQPDEHERQIARLDRLMDQADKLENRIGKYTDLQMQTRNELVDAEKQLYTVASDQKQAEAAQAEQEQAIVKLLHDLGGQQQTILKKLSCFGVDSLDNILDLLSKLNKRLSDWQSYSNTCQLLEKQLDQIVGDGKAIEAVINTKTRTLQEKQQQLEQQQKALDLIQQERSRLYQAKDPDQEEARLANLLQQAEQTEKNSRGQLQQLSQQLGSLQARIETIADQMERRGPELQKKEQELLATIQAEGFVDLTEFVAARLPANEIQHLQQRARELEQLQTELKARQQSCAERLAAEQGRGLTDSSETELEQGLAEGNEALTALQAMVAAKTHRLKENSLAMERFRQQQVVVEAQQKEFVRWNNLHTLIGSSDGKKFRNFAQGLTFEIMVGHANQQLQKMTDRYLLVRDLEQPLELNVLDSYQAGEIRSTKNLSGGEGFIVSLSLALGLSQMASNRVRVDSLFLDEGFGTLDDDALDTALETLASLQGDGKLIGVISHVAALKERIGARIQVIPRSGGKSVLDGPGCIFLATNEHELARKTINRRLTPMNADSIG